MKKTAKFAIILFALVIVFTLSFGISAFAEGEEGADSTIVVTAAEEEPSYLP